MLRLPKTRIEPVTGWILILDLKLTGNIHLATAARIVEIGRNLFQVAFSRQSIVITRQPLCT